MISTLDCVIHRYLTPSLHSPHDCFRFKCKKASVKPNILNILLLEISLSSSFLFKVTQTFACNLIKNILKLIIVRNVARV